MRRRQLLNTMAAIAAVSLSQTTKTRAARAQTTAPTHAFEHFALNRMGFGPQPGDIERVKAMGFEAYVAEQLNPSDRGDDDCQQRLSAAELPRRLWDDDVSGGTGQRLTSLDKPLSELWQLFIEEDVEDEIWIRPIVEVTATTWIRAIYSRWQLQEVLVDFWHNHFNVNAYSDNLPIAVTWPFYDRTMRQNCLGNFREFLEAVAQSQPMLYYLDNVISRASPANENYARELFELHTLGADSYLNDQYQSPRDVPKLASGEPAGFIDEDIYEAARAFTGWTVANGEEVGDEEFLPNTGAFHYQESWHDPYRKIVLGHEFPPNQPPLADGRKVLDLLAYHPGTARHLCTKLCRRLVGDDPPQTLVEKAIATWTENQRHPNQIQHTVRTILLSPEFRNAYQQKVKRPFELLVSYLRATAAEVSPSLDLFWATESAGQILFGWPAPNGHPDTAQHWLSTNTLMSSWHALTTLTEDELPTVTFDWIGQMPQSLNTPRQVVDYWANRLIGQPLPEPSTRALMAFIAPEQATDQPFEANRAELTERLTQLVPLIAMSPEFQWR
ncbi:MAG: DUF1800 domain-containing protein [Cyanobacteria bacterium J06635_15]